MLLQKGDIVQRDDGQYIVILADEELCCLAHRYLDEESCIITDYLDTEIYDNDNEQRLDAYGFTYTGNVDKDIVDVVIEEMASEE